MEKHIIRYPSSTVIHALEDSASVGSYWLLENPMEEGIVTGHLRSSMPNAGIPRFLIIGVVIFLTAEAQRRKEDLTHFVQLENEGARKKLLHIFLEHGYEIAPNPENDPQPNWIRLQRIYKPGV